MQVTRRVADQSNQTSLPILYIKLSSALGFTWILGFIVPFAQVEFLAYLFVILNSLQGRFLGGAVALWLVPCTADQAVRVQALAWALCCFLRRDTLLS